MKACRYRCCSIGAQARRDSPAFCPGEPAPEPVCRVIVSNDPASGDDVD